MLTPELSATFFDSWALFDPDATGLIPMHQFSDLMFQLGSPLGWDVEYKTNPLRQEKSKKMVFQENVNTTEPIQFNDFLDKIILLYVIGEELR